MGEGWGEGGGWPPWNFGLFARRVRKRTGKRRRAWNFASFFSYYCAGVRGAYILLIRLIVSLAGHKAVNGYAHGTS